MALGAVSECHSEFGTCGNGALEAGEQCDGTNLGNNPCNGTPFCTDVCVFYCAECGNGVLDPGESCDDRNLIDGDGCSSDCLLDGECGDGILNPGEQCDDAAQNSDTEPDACRTTCFLPACSDGAKDTGEECDANDLNAQTCETMGLGFVSGGQLHCFPTCSFDTSGCCECDSGVCCDGCHLWPSSYVCGWNVETDYGCPWGTECGENVGVRSRDQYCSGTSTSCNGLIANWSSYQTEDNCTTQEICVLGNPVCQPSGSCSCSTTDHWSPTVDTETDNTGQQWNQTIPAGIRVEAQQSGAELQARVCKTTGTFTQDVYFSIYDAADGSGNVTISVLAATGMTCSGWFDLQNDTGYSEGEQFGGVWKVVSPATSESEWSSGGCSVSGTPSGTCWNGVSITLTRTCL